MIRAMKKCSLAVVILLFAIPLTAETLQERQARSIAILRAGVLSRPIMAPATVADYDSERQAPRYSRRQIVADDIFADPPVVVPRYRAAHYDTEDDRGHYGPPVRILIPPVTQHVSRSSGITYKAENSPHNDRSTGRFVRSWRR
jgi:hypothetical protein